MIILRFIVILILTAFSQSYAKDNTILILGDSLSAAYGIEVKQGWVHLLRNRLGNYSQDKQWNVVNASVSGETTAGGLARLPGLILQFKPSLCIIELGANNGLRGQSTSLIQRDLDQMIKQCNTSGTSLLVGLRLPPNYGKKYTQAFHQTFPDVAQENDILLVPSLLDGIALQDKYFQADGLHPTAEAQPLILDNIWPTLIETINTIH